MSRVLWESILSNGLLCASEELTVRTDPLRVRDFGVESKKEIVTRQTRACFTHGSLTELSLKRVKANFISFVDGCQGVNQELSSHFDLFGRFAIAIDPLEARRIGVMPAMYYYSFPEIGESGPESLLRRLSETRQTLLALHTLEEKSDTVEIPFLHSSHFDERASSRELGLVVDNPEMHLILERTSKYRAKEILMGFQFDRRTFWQLVDKIEYLLGLFQNADSTLEDSPLAYYEQREWRLPYNSQQNTIWYSLGLHPKIRDPNAAEYRDCKQDILKLLKKVNTRELSNEERKATWVLHSVDGSRFSRLIRSVVCPKECLDYVTTTIDSYKQNGALRDDIKIVPN